MAEGKPHPAAATGGGEMSRQHDAADQDTQELVPPPHSPAANRHVDLVTIDDEAFAYDLYMAQLMEQEYGDGVWSRFAPGPFGPGSAGDDPFSFDVRPRSFVSPGAGSSDQRDVVPDDAAGAAAATAPVQRYVPPPARSERRILTTRPQPPRATGEPVQRYVPPPARSGTEAFLPGPLILGGPAADTSGVVLPQSAANSARAAATASTLHVGTSASATASAILSQALPAVAPTNMSPSPGNVAAGPGASLPTQAAPRPPRAGGRRAAGHATLMAVAPAGPAAGARQVQVIFGRHYRTPAAGDARWARATNLMAALQANPVPDIGQIGRIWTRISADRQFAAGADNPAVSAAKGEGNHKAPAVSAGKGVGDHSNPAVSAAMEEEAHRNVNDPISSKRQILLADRDTPAVFAGMEEGDDNAWYDSVIREAVISELQEDPELQGPLPVRCLTPRSPPRPTAPSREEGGEFSMPSFFKKWGLRPSDIDPEEAGPSTRLPRVLPLADDDLPTFDCGICFDTLPLLDLFRSLQCGHTFCLECMTTYVEGKVREGDVPIPCPDPECKGEDVGILHPEGCKKAIDFAAFNNWGLRLAEGAVPHSRRAYCPNRRCGILLETSCEDKPAMAACPACNLLLCATCGMEWSTKNDGEHRDCAKGPDAAAMRKLAEERRWKQCPKCKMMVERIAGCRVMHCRCRMVFCYDCGLQMGAILEGSDKCKCDDGVFLH